jgi:hypothetical protein
LLQKLINKQTLPGRMSCTVCPKGTGAVAKERPLWMEEAFWRFIDQKWSDSLNVAGAAPQVMDHGQEMRKNTIKSMKNSNQDKPRRGPRGQGGRDQCGSC